MTQDEAECGYDKFYTFYEKWKSEKGFREKHGAESKKTPLNVLRKEFEEPSSSSAAPILAKAKPGPAKKSTKS